MMADAKTNLGGKGKVEVAPENRRMLEWLQKDAQQKDELDEEWWDEFEDFLRGNRLRMRCDDEA